MTATKQPFVSDIKEIRRKAREHIEKGAVTPNYGGDIDTAIRILNDALATEIVCTLRYTFHFVTAQGLNSEAVKAEFGAHANEERAHALSLAQRINQLGGKPDLNPAHLAARSHADYAEGKNLGDMIKEILIAERIAVESYRDAVRYFGDFDPVTRRLLEGILAQEE